MVTLKVNINDIAAKTGLSITTVSRVLNGKAVLYRIGKKSQQKILEAAKELNYIPNQFAANLRSGKSKTIALIVPTLTNYHFAKIASQINSSVRKYGYTTLISESDENMEVEKTEVGKLISRNIEGLMIIPCGDQWDHITDLQERGFPIVCIDRYFEELNLPYVSTDNFEGAYIGTKHLLENGHRSIACIQGAQHTTPNKIRVKGFIAAMKEAGLDSYTVTGDEWTSQNGYLETKLLMQQNERPTAIFALANPIAIGCIKALREENIRIPEDVSLITFEDHPYLEYLATPLTCVIQPISDISKIAIRFLFAGINEEEVKLTNVLLKPEIKIRKSVLNIS